MLSELVYATLSLRRRRTHGRLVADPPNERDCAVRAGEVRGRGLGGLTVQMLVLSCSQQWHESPT